MDVSILLYHFSGESLRFLQDLWFILYLFGFFFLMLFRSLCLDLLVELCLIIEVRLVESCLDLEPFVAGIGIGNSS
jgi:hypothetical protein